MYHFSKYWRTWSRVLQAKDGWFVEVNLTPIPNTYGASTWENHVVPIRIRRHLTPRDAGDIETNVLPDAVWVSMIEHLGHHLVARLLYEDFLSQIDWDKYNQVCNGGANLDQIRKEQYA